MLPKTHRLTRDEVLKVVKNGQSIGSFPFSVKVLAADASQPSQFAFIVPSKSVKRAVDRNLVRRRARAVVEALLTGLKPGYKAAFFISAPALTLTQEELTQKIVFLLNKAKIL